MKNIASSIPQAIEDLKLGRMLIIVDNPKRENEADFYIPVDKVNPQAITTMIRMGGGLVCCTITQKQAFNLALPLMVKRAENTEKTGVNFTVSVNAGKDITTGVSANDRAKTIKILGNPQSAPEDLVRPGHVFGLVAKNGGAVERAGHTESSVDLAKLAGFNPAGVLCEILADNGKVANLSQVHKLAEKLNIKIILIDDLIKYLKIHPLPHQIDESEVIKKAESTLPTKYGVFKILIYKSLNDNLEHTVLLFGKMQDPALVRIHSQCFTGDTLLSQRCDCGAQLTQSMRLISQKGSGIIIYLNQEGRGIGLINKIKAYDIQNQGFDTVDANHELGFPADKRSYKAAADILKDLKVANILLLTNNPNKLNQLVSFGINIVKRVPLEIKPNHMNIGYLKTKKQKLGHLLKYV